MTRLDRIRSEERVGRDEAWLLETVDMAKFLAIIVKDGAPRKGIAEAFLARLEEPDA